MKHWGAFTLMLLFLGAALVWSEKQRIDAPVGPEAVLSLVADTERELTRLPSSFTRIPDDQEIKLGDQLAKQYASEDRFSKRSSTTQVVQAYVSKVGWRVATGAHRKLPYQFHYISDPYFINAFALPGGHVFIGGGLLALMDSEDELASVLGHEVEHIDHYHCVERVQTQAALRKLPLGEMVAIPAEVFEEGYSKSQELEADREGTRLAVKAGYSPLGALRMFQTYDRLFQARTRRAETPQEELSTLAVQTLEGYFASHPPPSERMAQIKTLISDEHWESKVAEQPLEVAWVYMTERAQRNLTARKYSAAEAAATRSLNLHAGQVEALAVLASAQFALMEFPAALASYQQVLKVSTSQAATVDEFANSLAMDAIKTEHFADAAKYASASLALQPDNSMALIALAEAQMATGDYTASGATYQRLYSVYPGEAQNVVNYTAGTARRALAMHHYEQARGVSAFWLTLRPHAREPLALEATVNLALGDFSAAAKAFRDALDSTPQYTPVDLQLVWNYADALSAANPATAGAEEFHTFMIADRPGSNATIENQIKIEYAGLTLMAGDSALARDLVDSPRGVRGSWIPPELMARLGWWYYRAAKYAEAEAFLRRLVQARPGDSSLRNDLAWLELENGELDAALGDFREIPEVATRFAQWNTPQMGLALALWRSHNVEEALKNYEAASQVEPRWTNPLLVQAFYSVHVAQSVIEIQVEQKKREITHGKRN